MTSVRLIGRLLARRGAAFDVLQRAKPVLEDLVRAVQVASQSLHGGGTVLSGERLRASGAKNCRCTLISRLAAILASRSSSVELGLDGVGEHTREVGHHLSSLGLQGRRLFNDPGERREPGAAEAWTLGDLHLAERRQDRLARCAPADRLEECRLRLRNLVEEEVFLVGK